MFACFGFEYFGLCNYDPANPPRIYFSVGEVIAALSITLIIPQFMKPIYLFRLRAQSVDLAYIYYAVFLAAILVIVSSILPGVDLPRRNPLAYPVLWEISAAVLFFISFVALAYPFLMPASMPRGNNWRFIQAAVDFLAHADERDRIDFSMDLLRNITPLIESARFLDWKEERSAFFDFAFRRRILRSEYSGALLRLVSEPQFCATLVHRSPWNTAAILNTIAEENLFARSAKSFVQELGRQAIVSQYSMIGREMEFKGFRSAPVLTDALFSDQFINSQYEPLRGIEFGDFSNVDENVIERLNHAVITCLRNVLEHHNYWTDHNLLGISGLYERVSHDVRKQIKLNEEKYGLIIKLQFGLTDIIKVTNEHLSNLEQGRRVSLYRNEGVTRDSMVLDYVAEAIVEILKSISNDFEGFDSRFWSLALDVIDEVFPRYREQPDGMNPLQQRVALKLIDEVRENMDGLYPAISRVMLAVIGPFGKKDELGERCAYRILERAFYAELQKYPDLSERDPKKAADFLPLNVRYVPERAALVHQYRGGQEQSTELRNLQLGEVSLSASVVGQRSQTEDASPARGE